MGKVPLEATGHALSCSQKHPFKFPKKIGYKYPLSKILRKRDSDDAHRLPPKIQKRRRTLVKNGIKKLINDGRNPETTTAVIDIGCSIKRSPAPRVDIFPCMTATRSAGCDWWLLPQGRVVSYRELASLQGFSVHKFQDFADTGVSARQIGKMLGNSMSVNVAERIISKALFCSGLIVHEIPDRWA